MNLIDYASSFLGTKYSWGGNTPEQGFDCSGFILEVLRAQIVIVGDMTAHDILFYCLDTLNAEHIVDRREIQAEDLVFYGKNMSYIHHVAMAINHFQIIEAGGEGRTETDKGFVRVRPLLLRDDFVCAVRIY